MHERGDQLARYKKELSDLGYHSSQIDKIIKEAIGTVNFDHLSLEQSTRVLDILQEYVRFASKCHKT